MQKGLKLMFFMKEKKMVLKEKFQYFMKISWKKLLMDPFHKCHKYFCIFFHFRTSCTFISFSEKNTYFGYGQGSPPPESRKYFVKFKRLHGYQFKIRYFYLPNNIPSSLHSELLNSNYCCFCHWFLYKIKQCF